MKNIIQELESKIQIQRKVIEEYLNALAEHYGTKNYSLEEESVWLTGKKFGLIEIDQINIDTETPYRSQHDKLKSDLQKLEVMLKMA